MSCELPEVYRVRRPLHDDWPWPFSLIPRRWTGRCLPMPPRQLAGNAPQRWMTVQRGYPMAPVALVPSDEALLVLAPDPVPPLGCWTVQAVYSEWLRCWVPCYFAFSAKVFGRRLHFNGPLKPDVTLGDWFWWIELSLSWTKIVP